MNIKIKTNVHDRRATTFVASFLQIAYSYELHTHTAHTVWNSVGVAFFFFVGISSASIHILSIIDTLDLCVREREKETKTSQSQPPPPPMTKTTHKFQAKRNICFEFRCLPMPTITVGWCCDMAMAVPKILNTQFRRNKNYKKLSTKRWKRTWHRRRRRRARARISFCLVLHFFLFFCFFFVFNLFAICIRECMSERVSCEFEHLMFVRLHFRCLKNIARNRSTADLVFCYSSLNEYYMPPRPHMCALCMSLFYMCVDSRRPFFCFYSFSVKFCPSFFVLNHLMFACVRIEWRKSLYSFMKMYEKRNWICREVRMKRKRKKMPQWRPHICWKFVKRNVRMWSTKFSASVNVYSNMHGDSQTLSFYTKPISSFIRFFVRVHFWATTKDLVLYSLKTMTTRTDTHICGLGFICSSMICVQTKLRWRDAATLALGNEKRLFRPYNVVSANDSTIDDQKRVLFFPLRQRANRKSFKKETK